MNNTKPKLLMHGIRIIKRDLDEQVTLTYLEEFYNHPKNCRPPSLSTVAKFLGVKSKRTAKKWLEKLKNNK